MNGGSRDGKRKKEKGRKKTHPSSENSNLDEARVVCSCASVDAANTVAEHVGDIARVGSSEYELRQAGADQYSLQREEENTAERTPTACPFRILTLRCITAGFIKQTSRVAMAMTWGMAQKLKTDWFERRVR
jgi:hypothetical protein